MPINSFVETSCSYCNLFWFGFSVCELAKFDFSVDFVIFCAGVGDLAEQMLLLPGLFRRNIPSPLILFGETNV